MKKKFNNLKRKWMKISVLISWIINDSQKNATFFYLKYNLDIIEYTVICYIAIEKKIASFITLLILWFARRNKIQFSPKEKGCKLKGSISNRTKIFGKSLYLAAI